MTLWITGANGFIGRHLSQALMDDGHVVHGIGHGELEHFSRDRLGLKTWLKGEIEAANLNSLAASAGLPSMIYHLAGGSSVGLSITQPYEDFSRTVVSTARLLEWLRITAPECRLVVASSAAVYGSNYRGPIAEADLALPMSPYGEHKLAMENLCRSYSVSFGLQTTVVRLFSVFGPELRRQLLWDLCSRLSCGEETLRLGGTGQEIRDWTDVRDVSRLLAALETLPQKGPFDVINGGSGLGTTVFDVASALTGAWGKKIPLEFSGVARAGDPFSLVANDARLREMPFKWQIPLLRGMEDYVRWFRERVG